MNRLFILHICYTWSFKDVEGKNEQKKKRHANKKFDIIQGEDWRAQRLHSSSGVRALWQVEQTLLQWLQFHPADNTFPQAQMALVYPSSSDEKYALSSSIIVWSDTFVFESHDWVTTNALSEIMFSFWFIAENKLVAVMVEGGRGKKE